MSYVTTTRWVDDDVIAESDDGTLRVVLRPDTDTDLDGDYLPILVRVGNRGVDSCAGERWYHPSPAYGDDDVFARAVDYFYLGSRAGRSNGTDYVARLTRWVRLFLGGATVAQFDRNGETFFACDSAALREVWGTPSGRVLTEDELVCDIPAFLEGETYGYIVQERACLDCEDDEDHEWLDTDETCWGLIGREWAKDAAIEALAGYSRMQ